MPSVSVILPTFNRTAFLRLAIASVFSQTFSDWELLIADDGSEGETQAYLRGLDDPRVRTLWLAHSGNPSRVRNAAIAAARGRFLAFLDSDDVWTSTKLQKQLAALQARPQCRWSYSACDRIDERGTALINERLRNLVLLDGWIFEPLLRLDVSIAMPAVVAERRLVQELGGFDEKQLFAEQQDLCLRLALGSEVVAVREALCSVRAHGEHYSADRIGAGAGWVRLYAKMAGLAPNPRLRACCKQLRAQASLKLAQIHAHEGRHRQAWATLVSAVGFSFRYPSWWIGALKALVRPAVPQLLLAARRARRSVKAAP